MVTPATGMAGQLADILRRYQQHRKDLRQAPSTATVQSGVVSGADLERAVLQPPWIDALEEVAEDPVRFALRASAREIGWRAYAHGGVELMQEVAQAMEQTGGDGAVLDKWWDGIGGPGGAVWLA